jgi:hypothetical protein
VAVAVAVGVAVAVAVGVGVGVAPDWAQYFPPVSVTAPPLTCPPQMIITLSKSSQTAV